VLTIRAMSDGRGMHPDIWRRATITPKVNVWWANGRAVARRCWDSAARFKPRTLKRSVRG
jgi:hypothetical protein